MRVASYVRVSTLQQVQTQTIEQQLERLQQYAQQQSWDWCTEHIFRDDGYSGASLTRPGLDRLRDKVAHRGFDLLLVTAPDRLARKYVHQMLLVEEFEQAGCRVEFIERPMSQDPNDQLLLQIRGAVAEYERSLIADRMRRGRQYKYRTGQLLPWTQPPYGYRSDPDRPRTPARVRLEPTEAALVAEIFARYLRAGESLSSVAKYLTGQKIPSPNGQAYWRPQSVRRLLTNPVYTGMVYAGRTQSRPLQRRRSPLAPVGTRSNGTRPAATEAWILVGQVPAIISLEQFEQVQAKLARNQQQAKRNNKAYTYLLRSLVSCGLCGLTCRGQTRRRYAYYQCSGKGHFVQNGRETPCASRLIPMKQLDQIVWDDLCYVLTQPEIMTQALQRVQAGEWLPQELQARRRNLGQACTHLSHQLERLTEAYLASVMSLAEYQRRRQEVEQRLATLEQQQRELEVQANRQLELTGLARHIEDFCQRVQVGLAEATFEHKRQLVELLIDRVVVTNEQVEIRYVIPTSPRGEHTPFYQLRQAYCGALQPDLQI
jgi:site-specific DNA recombinase